MSDIRAYFGGGGAGKPSPGPEKSPKKKGGKKKRVIESDEEDVEIRKQPSPKKAKPSPKKQVREKVDANDYFGGNDKNKVKKTVKPKVKSKPKPNDDFLDDEDDLDFDAMDVGTPSEVDEVVNEKKDEVKDHVKVKTRSSEKPRENGKENVKNHVRERAKSPKKPQDDVRNEDVKHVRERTRSSEKPQATSPVQQKTTKEIPTPKKASPARAQKSPMPPPKHQSPSPRKQMESTTADAMIVDDTKSKRAKPHQHQGQDAETRDILAKVPLVTLPPITEDSTEQDFNYTQFAANRAAEAPASNDIELPEGKENCLAGLTFVFTGMLENLSREVGQDLVKRYGGKVTTSVSSKTGYVVLGSSAGPKKLKMIDQLRISAINEEGLFYLIRELPANGGSSKEALASVQKQEKQVQQAREAAADMTPRTSDDRKHDEQQMWTVKYAPKQIKDVCGNKGIVEKVFRWLGDWQANLKTGFKRPGPDGLGLYRAIMISGAPGIGKTTAAHLVAKLQGYDVLEYNASDTRSKKLLETSLRGVLDNRSLYGYFGKGDYEGRGKLMLIMDEVDGMSAGDRGGVGSLAAVCRKTSIPMILLCNDRRLPKMKPFDRTVFDLTFRRPTAPEIRARIMSIAFREGMKVPAPVIDQLVAGTHSDIRQIINLLSTFRLDQKAMDFDSSKQMTKAWEKHIVLKPWDIAGKLLSGGMFLANSGKTLNDKIELYFNDHEFSYLMIQENYLKMRPGKAQVDGPPRRVASETIKCLDEAAQSISDGDLVDAMIHGSQQQWSLMPTHAIYSTVIPSYWASGSATGAFGFTSWLGNNSKGGKLMRMLREIQVHMRLKVSGDRFEVRQQYIPMLFDRLGVRLAEEGQEAVDEMIALMDEYYLNKDDYDAILELGVGPMNGEEVSKRIDTATKAAFTRRYNAIAHPMPFMQASAVLSAKGASKDKPDLEEALEESEDEVEEPVEEEEEDLSKDKYIKQPKGKGKGKASAPAKRKAKK